MRKASYSILLLVASALLVVSGCSRKTTSDFDETTAVETTEDEHRFEVNIPLNLEEGTKATKEVVETIEGGGEIGLTSDGTMVYNMGKFGEPGEAVFNHIASAWVKWNIPDEPALREVMDVTFGELSTKEELTKEILAMDREAQPSAQSQANTETKVLANNSDTNSDSQSGKTNTQNNTKSTQTTQAQTDTTGVQSAEPTVSPDWTPEDEARMQKTKEEWVANQPVVESGGSKAGKMDWDPDEAPGQWNWK